MKIFKLCVSVLLVGLFLVLNVYGNWYDKASGNGLYFLIAILIGLWGTVFNITELINNQTPKFWQASFLIPLFGFLLIDFYFRWSINNNFGEAFVRFIAVWLFGAVISQCIWRIKIEITK